ncbi:peptide chain release factor N(5)-glutamine methyltransferase [Orrella marina]|uniref:Release factor glutamine methyltransferase n=1 Tax=Orrella marina TaxID=2163011 RepID=A0A2R4XMV0_9BURK|nr:peptide chain release factor N(5)-glutamine methyltransferase [Orrella marina]
MVSKELTSLPSIKDCLARAELPRLELRMLLEHVLERPRAWMLAHDDESLSSDQLYQFNCLLQKRLAGEPMAYLIGRRSFMEFELQVTPEVLIPRPETELLVEKSLALISDLKKPALLDLGTGSGAIAIALSRVRPDASVTATDASQGALYVAKGNARRLGVQITFCYGNWFDALERGQLFDLIVSNPPYIHQDDEHLLKGDLRFEPAVALTDGKDGLSALDEIVTKAPMWLKTGGSLWVEHGYDQGQSVRYLLRQAGFDDVRTDPDLAGLDRISGGVWRR